MSGQDSYSFISFCRYNFILGMGAGDLDSIYGLVLLLQDSVSTFVCVSSFGEISLTGTYHCHVTIFLCANSFYSFGI